MRRSEDMHRTGNRPWALWERSGNGHTAHGSVRTLQLPTHASQHDQSDSMNFSLSATN